MVMRLLAGIAIVLSSLGIAVAHATPATCSSERLLPSGPRTAAGNIMVTARDLIALRDFGRIDDGSAAKSFRLSPDGKWAALIMRRADPDSDSYCFGVVLVSLDGSVAPRLLDIGGEFIPAMTDPYGASGVPSGLPVTDAPIWSPDGKSLAYLRRDQGHTQVWLVGLDGKPASPITTLVSEPRSLAWSSDGRYLLFTTRPSFDAGNAAIDREARSGFLYDERFWAVADARPHPRLPLPFEIDALDLARGTIRAVTPEAANAMKNPEAGGAPSEARLFTRSRVGYRAWVSIEDPARPRGPSVLHVAGAAPVACDVPVCREPIAGLWWVDPDTLVILQGGSASNGGRNILYRWRIGSRAGPRPLLDTEDWLPGCEPAAGAMICARESATMPRTLVRVDLASGRTTMLFDPNPEFGGLRLGSPQRLNWTDRDGVRTYGDLILPPTHRSGERHPLIVVQYLSRGFQRGGLGDEYPIQLFAERGYAVLDFQVPPESAAAAAERDDIAAQRVKVKDWSGRRRILTALDAGIDAAIALGVVDPDAIGITGMSDGASTVQFALNNSTRFKAAAISSCCDEPSAVFSVGPGYGETVLKVGYPAAGDDGRAFWRPQSLAVNADRIRVPLLMQLSDGEFRLAQEPYAALKAHSAPVEMYVFEDEWHTKQHPAHRLAIYERNLDWFDFWLRDVKSADPARASEIARWRTMRSGR